MTDNGTPIALTPREKQVAALVLVGETYAEIGRRLDCSPETVRDHVKNIAAKLGPDKLPAKTRVQDWAEENLPPQVGMGRTSE